MLRLWPRTILNIGWDDLAADDPAEAASGFFVASGISGGRLIEDPQYVAEYISVSSRDIHE